jgi:hypothetical protein
MRGQQTTELKQLSNRELNEKLATTSPGSISHEQLAGERQRRDWGSQHLRANLALAISIVSLLLSAWAWLSRH